MSDLPEQEILGGFESWLIDKDYAPTTIRQSMTDARQIFRQCLDPEEEPPPARLWAVARRLGRFLSSVGVDPAETLGPRFAKLCTEQTLQQHDRERMNRKREARSFDAEAWRALYQVISADESFEARVIETMMLTGLRVGDVFRWEKAALRRGIKQGSFAFIQKGRRQRTFEVLGPLGAALQRLLAAWPAGSTVQQALGGKYHTAYKRIDRKLKELAGALPGRAHTHRLRRTVAIRALEHTRNVAQVAKLLGHKNVQTTMGYLDEENPAQIAGLQAQLHEEFLK